MDFSDFLKSTPLIEAITDGDLDAIEALLDAGADPNEADEQGQLPLMNVLFSLRGLFKDVTREPEREQKEKEEENKEEFDIQHAVDLLAKIDVKEFLASRYERNPKEKPDLIENEEDDPAMMRLLLERGANVNTPSKHGDTVLRMAASSGRVETMKVLLEFGADTHPFSESGLNALMSAAQEREPEAVRLLLERGADREARSPNGSTLLMAAAQGGSVEIARLLIEKGADPNTVNANGTTALVQALLYKHPEMQDYLKSVGATIGFLEAVAEDDLERAKSLPLPEIRTPHWGFVVLDWAIRTGRNAAVRFLLDHEIRPMEGDPHSRKLLQLATMRGDQEVLKWLLDAGATVDNAPFQVTSRLSINPGLSSPIMHGDLPTLKLLVERGADVNLASDEGMTPLLQATMRGDLEMVTFLLDSGANVEGDPKFSMSPLLFATTRGGEEIMKLLLARGAKPHGSQGGIDPLVMAHNKPELTAILKNAAAGTLHDLAEAGDTEGVKAKIAQGTDVNALIAHGETALYRAAGKGHAETVKALIAAGADVNVRNVVEFTALIRATMGNHVEVVKILIEAGADIHAETSSGQSALLLATLYDKPEVVTLLVRTGAKIGAVEAAILGDRELLLLRLSENDNVESGTSGDMTPLMGAAAGGQEACLTLLLARGADLNAVDIQGQAPLHFAIMRKRAETVRWLIEQGADVNRVGENLAFRQGMEKRHQENPVTTDVQKHLDEHLKMRRSHTPLEFAAMGGQVETVRLLIQHGANVNTEEKVFLHSPLGSAVWGGNAEVVRILIEHGANVHAKDQFGHTPLHTATKDKPSSEIADILRQKMETDVIND